MRNPTCNSDGGFELAAPTMDQLCAAREAHAQGEEAIGSIAGGIRMGTEEVLFDGAAHGMAPKPDPGSFRIIPVGIERN